MTARKHELSMLALRYVSQRQARLDITRSTAKQYGITLWRFANSPGIPANPARLSRRHVERWMESRGRNHSPGTVRSQLSIVRSFCHPDVGTA